MFHQHRQAAIDDPLTEPPDRAVSRETLSRDAPSNLPAVTERHPLRDALRHAPAVHRGSRHARAARYAIRRAGTHTIARRGPSSRPDADGLRAPRGQSPDATSRSAGAPRQEVRLQPQIHDRVLSPLGADTAATFHLYAKPAPSRHRMRRPHAWARQNLSFERPSGGGALTEPPPGPAGDAADARRAPRAALVQTTSTAGQRDVPLRTIGVPRSGGAPALVRRGTSRSPALRETTSPGTDPVGWVPGV